MGGGIILGTNVDELHENMDATEEEPSSRTLMRASTFIKKKAFPMPKHWTPEELDELEYPSDLTLLTYNELGKQMGIWTSVIGYTQYQVAIADVEKTAKANKLEYERKKMELQLLEEGNNTDAERQAIIKTDQRLVKLQAESEVARAKFVMLKSLLDSYSKYFNSFSRELSRREVIGGERPPKESIDGEKVDLSEGREKGLSLFAMSEKRKKEGEQDDGDS